MDIINQDKQAIWQEVLDVLELSVGKLSLISLKLSFKIVSFSSEKIVIECENDFQREMMTLKWLDKVRLALKELKGKVPDIELVLSPGTSEPKKRLPVDIQPVNEEEFLNRPLPVQPHRPVLIVDARRLVAKYPGKIADVFTNEEPFLTFLPAAGIGPGMMHNVLCEFVNLYSGQFDVGLAVVLTIIESIRSYPGIIPNKKSAFWGAVAKWKNELKEIEG